MTISLQAICVGDELLDGRIRDRNAAALGAFAAERGYSLDRVTVVPDDVDAIVAALNEIDSDIVVVSGGLGPTDDDMTRAAAAKWAGDELVLDEQTLEAMQHRFASRGREFTDNNRRQALFPASSTVLPTRVGTAAGFRLEVDDVTAFFFPGVPREFAWYLEGALTEALPVASEDRMRRRLYFHGIGESALETLVRDIADDAAAEDVIVGYRADYPVIELKFSGPADATDALAERAVERAGTWLIGEDDETLPARLGRLLLDAGATMTTAESCTAGGIAALVTEISGSSGWFQRAWVTYANQAKSDELGVSEDVLLRFGAVSAQTVCQMASGARSRAGSTFAVAVSGVAGPTGGTAEKPVGTVHFGLATPEGVYHRLVGYTVGDRALIRAGTGYTALALLLWRLEDRMPDDLVDGPYAEDEVWQGGGIEPRRTS